MTARPPSSPQPHPPATPDWAEIRRRAQAFPPAAFDFVRDGLAYTVEKMAPGKAGSESVPESEAVIAAAPGGRHISGQQLCAGLREMARERYGMLALTVLHRWNVRATDDFGVMVYALIDRGEMRSSHDDRFEDFSRQYDFGEVFAAKV
ncbi:MAG: hypothetical protein K2Q09_07060 [Phycisphaerales bacterium]|nr:hypothetical protein [Phycisphaerales bacterium]